MFSVKPASVKAAAAPRRAVAPRAAADRRAVLGSIVAGVAALSAAPALADKSPGDQTQGPVDLFDDRKAKNKGFEIIYEARDLDLPQNERDGLSQYRGDLKATRERYKEASRRIQKDVGSYIDKKYWTEGQNELRNQVGQFRFDLKNIAKSKSTKSDRQLGIAKAKDLVSACERLDYQMKQKAQDRAKETYQIVLDKLKDFDSFTAA